MVEGGWRGGGRWRWGGGVGVWGVLICPSEVMSVTLVGQNHAGHFMLR